MEDQKQDQEPTPVPYMATPTQMLVTIGLLSVIFALVLASSIKFTPEGSKDKPGSAVECSAICEPNGVIKWEKGSCTCQEAK